MLQLRVRSLSLKTTWKLLYTFLKLYYFVLCLMTISIVFGLFLKRLFWGNFTAYLLKESRIILPYTTHVLHDDAIIAASALTSKMVDSCHLRCKS